jgi:hypothetical protein
MRILLLFLASFSAGLNSLVAQKLSNALQIDTITSSFLLEDDFRLTSSEDQISRPSILINSNRVEKLTKGYKNGVYLWGDSLHLGKYRFQVSNAGYPIMSHDRFLDILDKKVHAAEKLTLDGYEFTRLELTVVRGHLGIQNFSVPLSNGKVLKKNIPTFYIIEVL